MNYLIEQPSLKDNNTPFLTFGPCIRLLESVMSTPSDEQPFQINISDAEIAKLKARLALTRFPDELEDAGWAYGTPLADIKRLVTRWQDGYDWRPYEKELNDTLPQFTKDIAVEGFGTFNVHYVHKRSEVATAIPLLFVHGWPGAFFEVKKILPLLTQTIPDEPTFHVVTFSLPGYGFTEAPKKKGFTHTQFAEIGNKLMISLGYDEYVTQGGDWGTMVTTRIAGLYGGDHCKAWHINLANWETSTPPTFMKAPFRFLKHSLMPYTAAEKAGLARTEWFRTEGMGYYQEQSTQPQTLGYSLADSPVGLLAWLYEKLVTWTDSYPWTDDEILNWVSLYWFSTAGPAASVRIYYEHAHDKTKANWKVPTIPTGISYFPKELLIPPRSWMDMPKLVFEGKHDNGGHFAAYEKPAELVGDLRKMFGKGGPAFGVVKDNTGY